MKYVKSALAAATHKALESHREWHNRRDNEDAVKFSDQVNDWNVKHHGAWLEACKAINRKLRKGLPITCEDVPRENGRHTSHAYFGYGAPVPAKYVPPAELVSLAAILETVSDDYVTSAGLRELGISAPTLRNAVSYMTPGSVSN